MKFFEIFLIIVAAFVFISQVILPLLFNKPIFPLLREAKAEVEEIKPELSAQVEKVTSDFAEVKTKVDAEAEVAAKLKATLYNLTKPKQ